MDAVGILEAVALLVPEDVATVDDITFSDVWDHLTHDEWKAALDLRKCGGTLCAVLTG